MSLFPYHLFSLGVDQKGPLDSVHIKSNDDEGRKQFISVNINLTWTKTVSLLEEQCLNLHEIIFLWLVNMQVWNIETKRHSFIVLMNKISSLLLPPKHARYFVLLVWSQETTLEANA